MTGPSDRTIMGAALAAVVGSRVGVGPGRLSGVLLGTVGLVGAALIVVLLRVVPSPPRSVAPAGFALLVGLATFGLSQRANDGLRWSPRQSERVRAGPVWAQLVRDPELTPFGARVELRVGGRHVLASAGGPVGWNLMVRSTGEWVRVRGALRPLAGPVPAWLRARHIGARFTVRRLLGSRPAGAIWRSANAVRAVILRGGRVLPRRQQPLYGGFLLGDDRGQRAEVTDDFRGAGLTHLLVVSGQNVAFLFVAASPVLRRMQWHARYGCAIALLVAFLFVTRFEPSVLRAVAMAGVGLTARYRGDLVSPMRALALAVILLLLIDPLLAWSVGFALSVGACAGIAFLAKPIRHRLHGPSFIAEPLAVTLAAQIGTAPFLVGLFGGLPLASIPANLLALPAAEPVMVWGLTGGLVAGAVSGVWGGALSRALQLPTHLLLAWIEGVARRAAWLPVGSITGPFIVVGAVAVLAWQAVRPVPIGGDASPLLARRPAREVPAIAAVHGGDAPPGPIRHRTQAPSFGSVPSRPRRIVVLFLSVAIAWSAIDLMRRRPADSRRTLLGGAQLWRAPGSDGPGRTTVLVISHPQLSRLLSSIRGSGLRRVDVLVVDRSFPLDDLRALLHRVPTRLIVAPLRAKLRTASSNLREVPSGTRVYAGPFVVELGSPGSVVVAMSARSPPMSR